MSTIATSLTVLGAATFAIIVGWLHAVRSDLDPRDKGISHYATGRTYGAMTGAFVALAVGLLAAVVASTNRNPSPSLLGLVASASAAFGLLVVAAVPVPAAHEASWRGPAHTAGALLFFVASALGVALLSRSLVDPARQITTGLVALVVLFFLGMAGAPGLRSIRGWLQRGCFALVVAWLLVAGGQFAS